MLDGYSQPLLNIQVYFLLSSSFSPDFDLPSFSSQALSQVKDSHYQVAQSFSFSLLSPDVSQGDYENGLVRSLVRTSVRLFTRPSICRCDQWRIQRGLMGFA